MVAKTQMQRTNQQVRGFVIVWTMLTLFMGLATFAAIFFAYQPPVEEEVLSVADNNNSGGLVVIASQTPLPVTATQTSIPLPTATPTTQESVVVAQAPTETPAPTNTPEPTAVPPDQDRVFMAGVQIQVPPSFDPDEMNGWYRSAQQMNLQWVKIQVRWEVIESERGVYFWDGLDLAMAGARFFGIRPMLSIVTAPDWAREPGVYLERHGPPANFGDYVTFVRTVLERYPGQVYAIEVWNEQNLDREWTSVQGLSARNYIEMLRQTYNMVQEVSNGTIVISGALSPTGLNDGIGAYDDFVYMQGMIDNGLLDVTDCVGAHHNGYNISPLYAYNNVPNDPSATFRGPFNNPHHSWSFRSTLEGYTQRIRAAGSDKKLCVTEFGWAVTEDLSGYPRGFEFANDNSLAEQAQYFTEALDWMSSGEDVWLAFVWNLNYGAQAGWDPTNDNVPYSLIGPDFTFRPAFDAIRDWNTAYLDRIGRR